MKIWSENNPDSWNANDLNFILVFNSLFRIRKFRRSALVHKTSMIRNSCKKSNISYDKKHFAVRMANQSICERENQSMEHTKRIVREQKFRLFDVLPCESNLRNHQATTRNNKGSVIFFDQKKPLLSPSVKNIVKIKTPQIEKNFIPKSGKYKGSLILSSSQVDFSQQRSFRKL